MVALRSGLAAFALVGMLACGSTERRHGGTGGAVSASQGGSTEANRGGATAQGGRNASSGGNGGAGGIERSPNAWAPVAVPLGAPGWRTSQEPFCDSHQGDLGANSVWADTRGVFAIVREACIPRGRDLPSCTEQGRMAEGTSLNFNDGSGWRVVVDQDLWGDLTGIENGPLLSQTSDCAVLEVQPEVRTTRCALDASNALSLRRPFVVGPGLAYAIGERTLYGWRGGRWSTLVERAPEPLNALWASEAIVYVAGDYGLYSYTPGSDAELRELPNAPAAQYTSAWGFSDSDVWFGNSAGQLTHYDGQDFTRTSAVSGEYPGITGLWGNTSVLYFISWKSFGRLAEGHVETLIDGNLPDAPLQKSLWGTSPNDVFLALGEPAFRETTCGGALFLYFDGQEFHRF